MFGLAKGLYDYYTQQPQFNIAILGLDNAGKTTLMEQLKARYRANASREDSPVLAGQSMPTVGLNVGKIESNGTIYQLWDLGGHPNLHTIWSRYYADAHAVLFVVDSTDASRLDTVRRTFAAVINDGALAGAPVLIVANKQDRDERLGIVEIKEIFNPIIEEIDALEGRVMPISALTGDGVREAFTWLIDKISKNIVDKPPIYIN